MDDHNNNKDVSKTNRLPLELTENIRKECFISSFIFDKRLKSIILVLNHNYNNRTIVSPIISTNWPKTTGAFVKQMKLKGVNNNHALQLADILDNNFERILGLNNNGNHNSPNAYNTYEESNKGQTTEEEKPKIDVTAEEWQTRLKEKYQNLYNIVKRTLPNLWPSLEFEISIQKILNIKGCTLPFAGIVLGRPSSLKTVGIELFRKHDNTFYTDNFSAKAFVSHSTAVSREQLAQIDMLPKIKNKCFLTPELSPTFSSKDEDLNQILGIMTRILDGHGYESDTGAHGHRGYNEEMMFVWIGAAVDIPFKVHKLLGTLGPKLYFLRLPKVDKTEDDYYDQIKNDDFGIKVKKIESALSEYQNWFENGPELIVHKPSGLSKMPWDFQRNDEKAQRHIIKLSRLLAHLRGVVPTWHTNDTQGSDYAYTLPTIEEPDRAIQQLTNLARGHALSLGRNYITIEDIPLLVKLVLSTASIERVTIFSLLIANKGKLTTTQITHSLNTTNPTAKRTMTELKALGLVDMEETRNNNNIIMQIILKPEFEWFLTDEFQKLREGFEPTDNSEYLLKKNQRQEEAKDKEDQEGLKEKKPPTTEDKEEIFWQIYTELEDEQSTNPELTMEIDKETVSGAELKNRLVSSGDFYVGDAVLIIENMVKSGKLKKVSFDTYCKIES